MGANGPGWWTQGEGNLTPAPAPFRGSVPMSGRPFPSLKEKFIDGFQTESLRSVTETRVNKLRGPTPAIVVGFTSWSSLCL